MSTEARIPTPLVLAAASAMISIGAIALWSLADTPEEEVQPSARVAFDDRSEEAAAEAFLDAWRKRDHDVANRLSLGEARAQVQQRRARDAALTDAERELRREVWDAMASTRLRLVLRDSERLENGDLRLTGTAEGTFIERAYSREVEFEVRDTTPDASGGYRVVRVRFGEILSELPPELRFER